MTSKKGKANKAKRKAARKFYDANMKATPTQRHKAAKHKQATYIEKLRPRILDKNARHRLKELRQ